MSRIKKALFVTAVTVTTLVGSAGAAFASNPHAGNSGHFKGSAQPCPQNQQQCPPQGGK